MNPFVETSLQGPIARIVLRRPDKLNALDRDMVDALGEAARAIEASRQTRVAILYGEGKAFCAGGEARKRAESLAAEIAARGPLAVQMVKAMINTAEGEDSDAPIEGLAGALTAMTEDLAEGVAAFKAKRAPRFVGR